MLSSWPRTEAHRRRWHPSIALALLLVTAASEACFAPSPEEPDYEVLTRHIADTYFAYDQGDCASVLSRTEGEAPDPRATGAEHSLILLRAFCLELAGETDEAMALYEQLSERVPLSFAALDARERLRILRLMERDPDYVAWVRAAADRASGMGKPRPAVDRVSAAFPPVAQALGLDGYAVIEFGVMPDGQTDAPIVVDAQPPLLFDGAALRAVRKWKYARDPNADESHRQVIRIVFRAPREAAPASGEPAEADQDGARESAGR